MLYLGSTGGQILVEVKAGKATYLDEARGTPVVIYEVQGYEKG